MHLGALAGGLGYSPLDHGPYRPQSDSRAETDGIQSLVGVGKLLGSLAHPVLYLRQLYPR